MPLDNDTLSLYHLTLKSPTSYIFSVIGGFYGKKKSQELVLATNTTIELWQPDTSSGKLEKICHQNTFGIIQCIDKLSDVGSSKDTLVITSDSGKLVVLEFNLNKNQFIPIIQEPHSKNGFRRTSPGEYLSVDPQNRAVMIASLEKNKLVYKIQTNSDDRILFSSPLEISKKTNLTLNLVALDTGYENPIFAAIECDYSNYSGLNVFDSEKSPLQLNYYELDQGLNHIVRSTSPKELPPSAMHMIPLSYPIGGVLIACNSYIVYDHISKDRLYLPIPIRNGSKETIIINHVVHKLKKNNFFVLIQSTLGDLFKISVDYDQDREAINDMRISYFDTIPECTNINIFKSGFLFANVRNNDKLFYQFEKLGDDTDKTSFRSSNFSNQISLDKFFTDERFFKVHGLENLALVYIVETLVPLIDSHLMEYTDPGSPDPLKGILTLSSHAYLKTLIHGFPITTIVESPLPITPTDIYTTKLFSKSLSDEYLVISSTLSSKTLVLSIGEVVEEVEDSQFIADQPTLAVQQVGTSSVIQIFANGIRHIKHIPNDNDTPIQKNTTDWFPPAGVTVVQATANHQQVLLALSNREICYFEIDSSDDQLIEYQDRVEMPGSILSLGLCKSQRKSNFAVVGCSGEIIQVISLKPHNCLETMTIQALSSNSTSILLILQDERLTVHIGMENGLYVRTLMDEVAGKLSDTQTRYLGSKPVRLSIIELLEDNCILAISSKPWIGHFRGSNIKLTPLLNSHISTGTTFISEDIGEKAIVGIDGNNLVIFTVGNEDSDFNIDNDFEIEKTKLRYAPKKMSIDNTSPIAYIIESEFGTKGPYPESDLNSKNAIDTPIDQDYYDVVGYEKVESSWASCIQVVDYKDHNLVQTIEFSSMSCALSICKLRLDTNQDYLVVGVTENKKFIPSSCTANYLYTFKVLKDKTLQFLHKTEIDKPPTAMISFNGKLLVGMDNYLRLFSLGSRQLLRKSSSKIEYLKGIVEIAHSGGDRFVIGDSVNSMVFIKFDTGENKFIPIADDIMNRQITSMLSLDYYTVAGGDKFGNFFVSRIPESISKQSDGAWFKFQEPFLNASGARSKNLCEFFLQDIPTSFFRGNLTFGDQEAIIYTGLQGSIGLFLPLATVQEVEFLHKLELLLRNYFDFNFDDFDKEKNGYNLLGKDHLKFRSSYNPVKNVIDGDLIERFQELSIATKIKIGNELDRSPREIERKIFELRNRSSF